jgi:hypothetical protein
VGGGVQTGSTRHRGHLLPYCACPGWLWGWWIIRWNQDWQGKPKYSKKTCPSATLSTTNPTLPDPGSNPGRRGGKSATNRLSYGAAKVFNFASTPNLEYRVSVYICSSVTGWSSYTPQAPDPLFVTFYHSQGYCGVILTRLHMGECDRNTTQELSYRNRENGEKASPGYWVCLAKFELCISRPRQQRDRLNLRALGCSVILVHLDRATVLWVGMYFLKHSNDEININC